MDERILICHGDGAARERWTAELSARGGTVTATGCLEEAREILGGGEIDVLLLDLDLGGALGLALLDEARRLQPDIDGVVLTAGGAIATAVAAMDRGAADYLVEPFRFGELELRLDRMRRNREQRAELARLRALLDGDAGCRCFTSHSPAMRMVCEAIHLCAETSAPVLLLGEVGTGKELVARAIHDLGPRRALPFAVLGGTGGLGDDLERARGTLLLDDVDELDDADQAELLWFLEESAGAEPDARVVATTEIDLRRAVEEGRFRVDLLRILRGLEIRVPPLRERGDDVLLLARHFLGILAGKDGRIRKSLSPGAIELLRAHDWPGNVGELRRAIAAAFARSTSAEIEPADMPEIREPARPFRLHLESQPRVQLEELVRQFETELVEWALDLAHGQACRAAEILGVPTSSLEGKKRRT